MQHARWNKCEAKRYKQKTCKPVCSMSFCFFHRLNLCHASKPKEKKRQKPHLSYNMNKICVSLNDNIRFENSSKKKFQFFFFWKSSLRSLPTITSFDYNVENNFWFIEILFYEYISDFNGNYLSFLFASVIGTTLGASNTLLVHK